MVGYPNMGVIRSGERLAILKMGLSHLDEVGYPKNGVISVDKVGYPNMGFPITNPDLSSQHVLTYPMFEKRCRFLFPDVLMQHKKPFGIQHFLFDQFF